MKPPVTVTASEIADYVFCPEAWRLAKTGQRTTNQPPLDAGKEHHVEKAAVELTAQDQISGGWFLIAAAVVTLLVCLWLAIR
jgi:hypothetical protein